MSNKPAKGKPKQIAHGSPTFGENGFLAEAGDNTKFLSHNMELYMLPPYDRSKPEEVEARIQDYFRICVKNDMRPNVAGLALALDIDRTTLRRWKEGELRSSNSILVKKAYDMMESLMQDYAMTNKIHPGALCFLFKNCFGYTDNKEIVITPNNPLGDIKDPAELERRYIEDAAEDLNDE